MTPEQTIYEAYKSYPNMTPELARAIVITAGMLGANPFDLANIIRAESKFDPKIVNKATNAVGLIQFLPRIAQELGTSSAALWEMSAVKQMEYVAAYFLHRQPVNTFQRMAMAVFYYDTKHSDGSKTLTGAGDWPLWAKFPSKIAELNPIYDWKTGQLLYKIESPGHYLNFLLRSARINPSTGAVVKPGTLKLNEAGQVLSGDAEIVETALAVVAPRDDDEDGDDLEEAIEEVIDNGNPFDLDEPLENDNEEDADA